MSTERKKMNTQIYDEAAEWFVDFREGDVDHAGRRRFAEWLRTSPEHLRAYLELAAIYNEGPALDPEHRWDDAEVEEAKVVAGPGGGGASLPEGLVGIEGKGVTPGSAVSGPSRLSIGKPKPRGVFIGLAATFLLVIALGSFFYYQRGLYTTGIGEQRLITLSDGSHIELNANSAIRESFDERERRIELIRGQGMFRVAKDRLRPFIVASAGTKVRAVGTQFDVYQRSSGTTVTVLEGSVAISSRTSASSRPLQSPTPQPAIEPRGPGLSPGPGEVLLAAGEQVIVTAQATVKPSKPNIAAATAWTQRKLVFEGTALAEVAEEFNRYNPRRLVIQSPELRSFQITGIFSSTDASALLRFLRARPDIVVTEGKDEILVSKAD